MNKKLKTIMLSKHDIEMKRKELTEKYGDEQNLIERQCKGIVNTDELLALRRFDDLDYLELE